MFLSHIRVYPVEYGGRTGLQLPVRGRSSMAKSAGKVPYSQRKKENLDVCEYFNILVRKI